MLQGDTCLLNAAIFVNNEAAEVLLAHGADPNIGNVSSQLPIASIVFCMFEALDSIIVPSCQHVNVCIMNSCVHWHAKSSPAHKIYEDAKSQLLVDKVSVVHYMLQNWTDHCHAACNENEDLCKLLISYGADKTAKTIDVSRVLSTSMHCIGHATALVV